MFIIRELQSKCSCHYLPHTVHVQICSIVEGSCAGVLPVYKINSAEQTYVTISEGNSRTVGAVTQDHRSSTRVLQQKERRSGLQHNRMIVFFSHGCQHASWSLSPAVIGPHARFAIVQCGPSIQDKGPTRLKRADASSTLAA